MKKILIADDEEILRMLIEDTLEDLPVSIEQAVNGQEALDQLQTNSFDLVILDYMMPERSGREVLNALDPEVKSQTTIIMLTAKTQQEDQEMLLQEGADYFMAKPFSPAELREFVGELIHG